MQPLQGKANVRSQARSEGTLLFTVFLRSTKITGITSCPYLVFLELLVLLASLLRCTGKCAIAYREVRFEKHVAQLGCGSLYREVRGIQLREEEVYREVRYR